MGPYCRTLRVQVQQGWFVSRPEKERSDAQISLEVDALPPSHPCYKGKVGAGAGAGRGRGGGGTLLNTGVQVLQSWIVWRPKTERNDPRISRTGGRHSNTGPSRLSCCKDKVGEGQGAMPGSPALKVDALPLGHRGGRVVRMKLERGRGGGRAGGGEGQHAVEDFMLCRTEVEKCSICLCCGNCAGLIFRHLHIHLLVRSALTRDLGLGFRSGSGQP